MWGQRTRAMLVAESAALQASVEAAGSISLMSLSRGNAICKHKAARHTPCLDYPVARTPHNISTPCGPPEAKSDLHLSFKRADSGSAAQQAGFCRCRAQETLVAPAARTQLATHGRG